MIHNKTLVAILDEFTAECVEAKQNEHGQVKIYVKNDTKKLTNLIMRAYEAGLNRRRTWQSC